MPNHLTPEELSREFGIDRAEVVLGCLHGRCDLGRIGHVEIERKGAVRAALGQIGHPRLIASRDDGPPVPGENEFGQFTAEAGRAAGDEPHRRGLRSHRVSPVHKRRV